jgi:hypothetical protein
MCSIKFKADEWFSDSIRFSDHMEMDISTRAGRLMVQVEKQVDGTYTLFLSRFDGDNWQSMGVVDMDSLQTVEFEEVIEDYDEPRIP